VNRIDFFSRAINNANCVRPVNVAPIDFTRYNAIAVNQVIIVELTVKLSEC